jgi:hypothetical protein
MFRIKREMRTDYVANILHSTEIDAMIFVVYVLTDTCGQAQGTAPTLFIHMFCIWARTQTYPLR